MRKHQVKYDFIKGWFLNFFYYLINENYNGKIETFKEETMKVKDFKKLASQMLIVPFIINDMIHKKKYEMKYKVGFVGCEQNERDRVSPVQGWIVSPSTKEDKESLL